MSNYQKVSNNYHYRWMIRRDLPEVVAINEASFKNPWTEEQFLQYLRQRRSIGVVIEVKEKIAAFMLYTLSKRTLNLDLFAVAPTYRRLGVGTTLMQKMKSKLEIRDNLLVSVHEADLSTQLFMRSNGFKAIRIEGDNYIFECRKFNVEVC